jgi:methyl coenzyme M reductase subunit D
VYLENKFVIIDELCPMGYTVSQQEFMKKEKIVEKFLKKLDNEVQNRRKM